MREIIKMIVVLTLISGVSGVALSGLNEATKDIIAKTKLEQEYKPAIESLMKGFDNDPIADVVNIPAGKDKKGRDLVKQLFPAKKGGALFAIGLVSKGTGAYNGDLTIMLAIDTQTDSIMGAKVIEHTETKGVGTNHEEPYLAQYVGKKLPEEAKIKALGGTLDGMSGATMSSTAISNAAQSGLEYYIKNKDMILSKIK